MINTKSDLEKIQAEDCQPLVPGMVVFLKSSGLALTVRLIQEGAVTCEWFDKERKLRTHDFLAASLTPVQPNEDGKPRGILLVGRLDDEDDDRAQK